MRSYCDLSQCTARAAVRFLPHGTGVAAAQPPVRSSGHLSALSFPCIKGIRVAPRTGSNIRHRPSSMSATSNPRASPKQFRQRDDDFTLGLAGFGANFTLDTSGDGANLPPLALSDAPGLVVYEYFVGESVAVGTAAADVDWSDPAYTGEPPHTVGVELSSDSVRRRPRTTVERLDGLQDLLDSLRAAEARTGAAGPAAPDAEAGNPSKVKEEFLHPTGAYQRIL